MLIKLFQIFIFPGMLFLLVFSLWAQYLDRKIVARLQNRVGPPYFQPLADYIKLLAKERIIPAGADMLVFNTMPLMAIASSVTAFLYIPLFSINSLYSFYGDVIVVLYLLMLPSLTFFLGGWYSRSVYSMIGAVRSLVQLFAYEVPLFMVILAAALLANTWSLSDMALFYNNQPWLILCNLLGFGVALVTLLGKLEKVPFDIPEAETEMVAGPFTEYSGKLFAFFRLCIDVETIVAASLIAAVFMPFGLSLPPLFGFILYLVKVILVVMFVSLSRSLFARLRIDQMVEFCWKYVAPLAGLQILFNLVIKGVFLR